MPRIFISYRRDDSAGHAGRIYDRLVGRFGRDNVFMDVDTIDAGTDFVDAVEGYVASCDVLLAVIGKRWLSGSNSRRRRLNEPGDFVRLEVGAALNRNIRLIPILIQDADIPATEKLPDELKPLLRRQAIELRDSRWNQDCEHLVTTLERIPGLATRAPATEHPPADQPAAVVQPERAVAPDPRIETPAAIPTLPSQAPLAPPSGEPLAKPGATAHPALAWIVMVGRVVVGPMIYARPRAVDVITFAGWAGVGLLTAVASWQFLEFGRPPIRLPPVSSMLAGFASIIGGWLSVLAMSNRGTRSSLVFGLVAAVALGILVMQAAELMIWIAFGLYVHLPRPEMAGSLEFLWQLIINPAVWSLVGWGLPTLLVFGIQKRFRTMSKERFQRNLICGGLGVLFGLVAWSQLVWERNPSTLVNIGLPLSLAALVAQIAMYIRSSPTIATEVPAVAPLAPAGVPASSGTVASAHVTGSRWPLVGAVGLGFGALGLMMNPVFMAARDDYVPPYLSLTVAVLLGGLTAMLALRRKPLFQAPALSALALLMTAAAGAIAAILLNLLFFQAVGGDGAGFFTGVTAQVIGAALGGALGCVCTVWLVSRHRPQLIEAPTPRFVLLAVVAAILGAGLGIGMWHEDIKHPPEVLAMGAVISTAVFARLFWLHFRGMVNSQDA